MQVEWENIHNKVLFDAFNNALNQFRPFGKKGPPLPWTGQQRSIGGDTHPASQYAEIAIEKILDQAKKKVIDWVAIEAGTRKIPPLPVQPPSTDTGPGAPLFQSSASPKQTP
jgi:hypothetical protein